MLNILNIQKVLPHRYPFLLVDRILEIEEGKKIVGLKNVTVNEEFFQGHYPGHPIMPGVLIIESMAQVGGFLMINSVEDPDTVLPLLTGVDKARFRRSVMPGDSLRIEAETIKARGKIAKVAARAKVEDDVVAEAELMFVIEEK